MRNVRLFLAGQLISQVGNGLTVVVQILLVLKLTDSGYALGLLSTAQFGPILLFGAFAGLVADRSDKRRLLVAIQAVGMVQSLILAGLGFLERPSLLAIYAVAFLGGVVTAFDHPARRSFVGEMVPEDEINNAMSLNIAVMTTSRVLGPALAGVLVTTIGFGWCFLLDAASYLAVIAALWRVDPTQLWTAPPAARGKRQVREALRHIVAVPELRVVFVMMTVAGTLAFNFRTVVPLLASRDLGGTDLTISLIMAVVSCGSLIGALATARGFRIGVATVSRNAAAFGGALTLLCVAPNRPAVLVAGFFTGAGSVAFTAAATAISQVSADPTKRGRVLALQTIVFLGTTSIGGPLVGTVSETFGARYGIALGAGAAFVAAGFGFRSLRRIAARPRPPP